MCCSTNHLTKNESDLLNPIQVAELYWHFLCEYNRS